MKKIILLISIALIIKSAFAQVDSTHNLNEVKVVAPKDYELLENNINLNIIKTTPVNDIGQVIKSIPGISLIKRGGTSFDPVIRHYRYNQINTLINNVAKVEGGCPNRMDPATSHIDNDRVESIDVIFGPHNLKYGSTLGGTILLNTSKPNKYKKFEIHSQGLFGFEDNGNGQRENISVYGGNKSFFFDVSGGMKNYGNYVTGNGETVKSSFKKQNYNAELGYNINKYSTLKATYLKNIAEDVMYPALSMDEALDNTDICIADYYYSKPNSKMAFLNASVYYSGVLHKMDNTNKATFSKMEGYAKVDAKNMGGRVESALNLNETSKLVFGTDMENILKDGTREMIMKMTMGGLTTVSKNLTYLWYNAQITNNGVFAEYNKQINKNQIKVSIRTDYNRSLSDDTLFIKSNDEIYYENKPTENLNLSYSLSLKREFSNKFIGQLSFGKGVRCANMLERYIQFLPVGFDNYDYLGNPSLKPETNYQTDLIFLYKPNTNDIFKVNFFYSYLKNYIAGELIPSTVAKPKSQGVLGVKQFANFNHVDIYGLEYDFKKKIYNNLFLNVRGSLVNALIYDIKKRFVSNNKIVGESMLSNDFLAETPPIENNILITYNLNKAFNPEFNIRIVSKQNNISDAMYEQSTPAFTTFGFSITSNIFKYITLKGGVSNITDLNYFEHLNKKIIGSTTKLYEQGRSFYFTLIYKL